MGAQLLVISAKAGVRAQRGRETYWAVGRSESKSKIRDVQSKRYRRWSRSEVCVVIQGSGTAHARVARAGRAVHHRTEDRHDVVGDKNRRRPVANFSGQLRGVDRRA